MDIFYSLKVRLEINFWSNEYFIHHLFFSGGRIDHGHHAAQAIKALDETVEFSNAIKLAVEMTNREDTLIVVTSDHAHTMSMSGYPDRGNPIAGLNTYLSDVGMLKEFPTLSVLVAHLKSNAFSYYYR